MELRQVIITKHFEVIESLYPLNHQLDIHSQLLYSPTQSHCTYVPTLRYKSKYYRNHQLPLHGIKNYDPF